MKLLIEIGGGIRHSSFLGGNITMSEQKVHFVTVEMSSLDEYSQRELNAYRSLGSVREMRRLKHQELHRVERRQRVHKTLEFMLAGAVFAGSLAALLFVMCLFA